MFVVFLYPEFAYGRSFAVGPDFPVYVWWTRVGATLGISLVGERPGIPALLATFSGTFRLPLTAAVSGLQYACAVSVSVLVVALVRGSVVGGRVTWMLAGGLAGIFAAHLANGYISNLAFTLAFLAAASALATREARGAMAAALLLGAGGLLHPQFFFLGAVILVVVAVWSRIRDADRGWSSDAGRIVLALAGGTAVAGAGLLWTTVGPARLGVATSKDALFRHIGLGRTLTRLYRNRLGKNIRRYALYVLLPLAAMGIPVARGFTRRFLVTWAALTLLAVPVGMQTGWFPPDRVITFSFALPVLAALGAVALWHLLAHLTRPWLAWTVVVVLVGVLVSATMWSWNRQNAYVKPQELIDSTLAGRIGATQPAGTPLVFIVNNPDSKLGFQTTQVANIARAAVPARSREGRLRLRGGRVAILRAAADGPSRALRLQPAVPHHARSDPTEGRRGLRAVPVRRERTRSAEPAPGGVVADACVVRAGAALARAAPWRGRALERLRHRRRHRAGAPVAVGGGAGMGTLDLRR